MKTRRSIFLFLAVMCSFDYQVKSESSKKASSPPEPGSEEDLKGEELAYYTKLEREKLREYGRSVGMYMSLTYTMAGCGLTLKMLRDIPRSSASSTPTGSPTGSPTGRPGPTGRPTGRPTSRPTSGYRRGKRSAFEMEERVRVKRRILSHSKYEHERNLESLDMDIALQKFEIMQMQKLIKMKNCKGKRRKRRQSEVLNIHRQNGNRRLRREDHPPVKYGLLVKKYAVHKELRPRDDANLAEFREQVKLEKELVEAKKCRFLRKREALEETDSALQVNSTELASADPKWIAELRASRTLQKINNTLEKEDADALLDALHGRIAQLELQLKEAEAKCNNDNSVSRVKRADDISGSYDAHGKFRPWRGRTEDYDKYIIRKELVFSIEKNARLLKDRRQWLEDQIKAAKDKCRGKRSVQDLQDGKLP